MKRVHLEVQIKYLLVPISQKSIFCIYKQGYLVYLCLTFTD